MFSNVVEADYCDQRETDYQYKNNKITKAYSI